MFYHFHPYEPFLRKNSTKVIIGTLPPPRFCNKEFKKNDVDFCYGSADGLLWKSLDYIFNLNLVYENTQKAIKQREEFLIRQKIGICDIVKACKRDKIDASDIGMKEVELRDILGYLKKYKSLHTLIFTGGLCKNSPLFFFKQVLKKHNIKLSTISEEIPKINKFIFDNREFKTISLTSPSNAANRSIGANKDYKKIKEKDSTYTTFDFRVEQYEKVFKDY